VTRREQWVRASTTATGDHVVVAFSTPAAHPVPARVWLTTRDKVSETWHRVTDQRSGAGTHVQYSGFKGDQLSGNSGTLTVSRPPSVEPTLAVVTVAYQ